MNVSRQFEKRGSLFVPRYEVDRRPSWLRKRASHRERHRGSIILNTSNFNDPFPTTATSAVVTLTGVKKGDLITVQMAIANNVTITVSDNINNKNYTLALTQYFYSVNSDTGGMFFLPNSGAGTMTITGTWVGNANQAFAIFAQAWSNAATTSDVQDSKMSSQQGTISSTNPAAAASAITPAYDGEVVLGFMITSLGTIPTAGAGFTALDTTIAGAQVYPEYWIQSARTATTGNWTLATGSWNAQMCAFKKTEVPPISRRHFAPPEAHILARM